MDTANPVKVSEVHWIYPEVTPKEGIPQDSGKGQPLGRPYWDFKDN